MNKTVQIWFLPFYGKGVGALLDFNIKNRSVIQKGSSFTLSLLGVKRTAFVWYKKDTAPIVISSIVPERAVFLAQDKIYF